MKTEHLKSAIVLSEVGTYRKASDTLFLEWNTVWRHVRTIEKELGFKIFDKKSGVARKHAITPEGAYFLKKAKQALMLLEEGAKL